MTKTCKWCGREFPGENREVVDGWVTCSEKCKKKLRKSIESGDTKPARRMGLGRLIVIGLLGWFVLYCFAKASEATKTAPVEPAPAPVYVNTDSTSAEPTPEPEVEEVPQLEPVPEVEVADTPRTYQPPVYERGDTTAYE